MDDAAFPVILTGSVVKGRRVGRELGFPTANLDTPPELLPENGIYGAQVDVGGQRKDAAAFIGPIPCEDGGERRTLEVHLLDFSGDLYGRPLTVYLKVYIRPVRKFSTDEELIRTIRADIEIITAFLDKND